MTGRAPRREPTDSSDLAACMHDQARTSSPPEGSYRPPRRSGFITSGSMRTASPSSAPPPGPTPYHAARRTSSAPPPMPRATEPPASAPSHADPEVRTVTITPAQILVVAGVVLAAAIAIWQSLAH